jgi:hypothetical protein
MKLMIIIDYTYKKGSELYIPFGNLSWDWNSIRPKLPIGAGSNSYKRGQYSSIMRIEISL